MDEDKRLSYFFLGLGIGVAVGILFAPKSGEETRQIIRSKADEGKELLKKRSSELKESASDLVDKSRGAVARQREQLNSALEAGRQAYRDAVASPGRES